MRFSTLISNTFTSKLWGMWTKLEWLKLPELNRSYAPGDAYHYGLRPLYFCIRRIHLRVKGGELGVLGVREHPLSTEVHPVRLSNNHYRSSETYVMQTCCVPDEYLT